MYTDTRNKLFLVLMGSFFAQIIQVGVFSLFLSQKLNSLGVSLSLIGWFVGIQWFAVLLVAPVAPRLCARYGLETLSQIACVITIIGLGLAVAESETFLAIASILLGAGLILRWIACDALVVQLAEGSKVGRSIGLHEALMGFGIAVGPLFFIFLNLDQVLYTMMFVALLATLSFYLIGRQMGIKEQEESAALGRSDVLLVKIALVMALVGGLIETAAVAFFPFYFAANGIVLSMSAWFVSAFGLGGTLLQLPLGYFADKVGYRRSQFLACLVAVLCFGALLYGSGSFVVVYSILFVLGGAVGAFNTLAVIQAGSELPSAKTASVMTYIAVAYTFGGIVGPVVTSNILHFYPADAIIVTYFTIILVVSVFILTDIKSKKQ